MTPELIGVCIIVLDSTTQKILLGKRLNCYGAGTLGLPGGRLELTETLESCAERELLEETSLVSQKFLYAGTVRELQGEHNFIHFVYSCNEFSGQIVNVEPAKCEGWEWYQLDNLPENILPGHKAALDMYLQHLPLKELL